MSFRMEMLFSQEEVWEMTKQELKRDRTILLGELMKKMLPLGRGNDLIAATADEAKLSALAREFGLQI